MVETRITPSLLATVVERAVEATSSARIATSAPFARSTTGPAQRVKVSAARAPECSPCPRIAIRVTVALLRPGENRVVPRVCRAAVTSV